MWFDAHAKLAEIVGQSAATSATTATQATATTLMSQVSQTSEAQKTVLRVASVASVAAPLREKSRTAPQAPDDELDPDAGVYLDQLRLYGPTTYGAMATFLGWGATRAWRAEAKLRGAGMIRFEGGKGVPQCD